MITIFKYDLQIAGSQIITMPSDAEILTVQIQSEQLQLWAVVNTENPPASYTIEMYGTGHALPSNTGRKYISTVQMGGYYVWHFFKKI